MCFIEQIVSSGLAPGLVRNVGVSNYDEVALRQMHGLLCLGRFWCGNIVVVGVHMALRLSFCLFNFPFSMSFGIFLV